jgi:16S rRNA C967 or C1407 C5-methylase (RsmB/RsmF family)/NOL1/NOP2/fmu family ribosome biogenesis protein
MLPEDFIKRIHTQKYIDAEALIKAMEEASPVSIRINSSKWSKKPMNYVAVPWCLNGYYLDSRPSYTLDPLFHSGCYYPQEASGMFLGQAMAQLADSHDELKVLDLCGAPGGKSTHLADIIGSGGLLIANEVIRARAHILSETITRWGSGNTIVTQNDPAFFGKLKGYFDLILVDAPCSGEGMFRTDIAVREWSVENTNHCSERQKRILLDIWPALKENGLLVYSTCTFNSAENEENIKWLTDKHQAECVRLDVSGFPGITEIDFEGIYGYGFYPDRSQGEGFFISVLRKTESERKIIVKQQKHQRLNPDKEEHTVVRDWTSFPDWGLLKWNEEIFSVPCNQDDYLFLFHNLKIVKAGTSIFTIKNGRYLPSHELALSQHIMNSAFHRNETDLGTALAYLRRDNFKLQDIPKGWNIVTYQGVNMGFINNLGNRINNYFPVEWRIRMSLPDQGTENIIKWSQENSVGERGRLRD